MIKKIALIMVIFLGAIEVVAYSRCFDVDWSTECEGLDMTRVSCQEDSNIPQGINVTHWKENAVTLPGEVIKTSLSCSIPDVDGTEITLRTYFSWYDLYIYKQMGGDVFSSGPDQLREVRLQCYHHPKCREYFKCKKMNSIPVLCGGGDPFPVSHEDYLKHLKYLHSLSTESEKKTFSFEDLISHLFSRYTQTAL